MIPYAADVRWFNAQVRQSEKAIHTSGKSFDFNLYGGANSFAARRHRRLNQARRPCKTWKASVFGVHSRSHSTISRSLGSLGGGPPEVVWCGEVFSSEGFGFCGPAEGAGGECGGQFISTKGRRPRAWGLFFSHPENLVCAGIEREQPLHAAESSAANQKRGVRDQHPRICSLRCSNSVKGKGKNYSTM